MASKAFIDMVIKINYLIGNQTSAARSYTHQLNYRGQHKYI
jgi:hypothetical protein